MVPVRGRPFLAHQLELLAGCGVTDVVLCVGYRGRQVERFVGDGHRWGLSVRCSRDGPSLVGTAGALRNAVHLLAPWFGVVYGDSYVPMNYPALLRTHVAKGRAATVAVYENADRWDRSNIVLDGDRVAVYDKRRHHPGMTWIDAGVTALDRDWVAALPAGQPMDLAEQFASLARAGQLGALRIRERFYEVGSPAGLAEFRRLIAVRVAQPRQAVSA
jgi:NDP-sugar pyrophosphorylase family protein